MNDVPLYGCCVYLFWGTVCVFNQYSLLDHTLLLMWSIWFWKLVGYPEQLGYNIRTLNSITSSQINLTNLSFIVDNTRSSDECFIYLVLTFGVGMKRHS